MAERLYTGTITAEEMPQIVTVCHFTRDALFLAEHIPQQTISSREEGHDLLSFTAFKEELAHDCAKSSAGRIFQEDRELRWEKQGEKLHIVYLGATDDDLLAEKLHPGDDLLATLKPQPELTSYYLFGERLADTDQQKLAMVAQPGDFAVLRIPRILHYPIEEKDKDRKYARLVVREYLDATTNRVALFRFQRLEAAK